MTYHPTVGDDEFPLAWPPASCAIKEPGIHERSVETENRWGDTFTDVCLFFVDDGGEFRGFLEFSPAVGEVRMIVDPDYRRRGVGSALLRYAVDHLGADLDGQHFTMAGAAVANGVRRR